MHTMCLEDLQQSIAVALTICVLTIVNIHFHADAIRFCWNDLVQCFSSPAERNVVDWKRVHSQCIDDLMASMRFKTAFESTLKIQWVFLSIHHRMHFKRLQDSCRTIQAVFKSRIKYTSQITFKSPFIHQIFVFFIVFLIFIAFLMHSLELFENVSRSTSNEH